MFSWLFNSNVAQDNNVSTPDLFDDDSFSVNPANGMPMMGNSGLDIEGNPFGTDFNDDTIGGSMGAPFDF